MLGNTSCMLSDHSMSVDADAIGYWSELRHRGRFGPARQCFEHPNTDPSKIKSRVMHARTLRHYTKTRSQPLEQQPTKHAHVKQSINIHINIDRAYWTLQIAHLLSRGLSACCCLAWCDISSSSLTQ